MVKLQGVLAVASLTAMQVSGLPTYLGDFPNSNNVFDCNGEAFNAVGHVSRFGSGERNDFGKDYERLRNWPDLCPLDSDNDGMTNGEELGDPLCEWRSAADDAMLMVVVGHPGLNCDEPPPTLSLPPHVWAHGILMLLAWLLFAPIGVVLTLANKTMRAPRVKSWFKLHQAFLTTTVFVTLIAFSIMWNAVGFKLDTVHTRIGFAVVILAIVQPLSGVFRPHNPSPGEQKSTVRLVWEYGHQWVGRTLMTLAIAASILGIDLAGLALEDVQTTDALGIAIIVLFCLGAVAAMVYVVFFRKDERSTAEVKKESLEKAQAGDQKKAEAIETGNSGEEVKSVQVS